MRFAVNCSILFTELPLLERPAAAKAAGFDAVEFWWPFPTPVPTRSEVDGFISAIHEADVRLIGLNFFAGDMPGGDRGTVSWIARSEEFRANLPYVVSIGDQLGCNSFNALYGNRRADEDPQAQDDRAIVNLALAARAVAAIGGTVLIEPVSGAPFYPLKTAADVRGVIARLEAETGVTNAKMLCDIYHLAANGDDVAAVCRDGANMGHVQIADAPGRGAPGTGELPLKALLSDLQRTGYEGWVALEYLADDPTTESFSTLRGLTSEPSA